MVRTLKPAAKNSKTPVYSISAASRLAGLPIWTLRWIEKHALVAPRRTDGNQRLYSDEDVERLGTIRGLLEKKVNLAGIRVILGMKGAAAAVLCLLLLACGPAPRKPQPLDDLDPAARAGTAAEAVRELWQEMNRDPTLASKTAGIIAAVGVEGVPGVAQALAERDQQLDMQLAQEPAARRAARLKAFQADDRALRTILVDELARLGPSAVTVLLDQAAAKNLPLSELKRGPLMREVGLDSLARMGEPAFPGIVESLRHPALREGAAESLARAGEPGRRLLEKMAGVADKDISAAAKKALKKTKRP
jgi:DNA-binding transcriptional MerR regulator